MPWPGLTTHFIKKYLPPSIHTELGHIKAERHGLISTKPSKTRDSIYIIIHNSDKIFMDLTGRFPYKSSRGNKYILIVYHVASNAILGTQKKTDKKPQSHKHGSNQKLFYSTALHQPIYGF